MRQIIDMYKKHGPIVKEHAVKVTKRLFTSKIDIVQSIALGIIFVLLIVSNFSVLSRFWGEIDPLKVRVDKAMAELSRQKTALEFDRVRLEDASNLLLALQEYYFQKSFFPATLEELKKQGYLSSGARLNDPETNQSYFYKQRQDDFVLCIQLSDMLKGVNTASCPSSSEKTGGVQSVSSQRRTAEQGNVAKLQIVGRVSFVNVRAEPAMNSEIIIKTKIGSTFSFLQIQNNWYKIAVREGVEGWVFGDYVKVLDNN